MNYLAMLNIGDVISRLKFPGVEHIGVVVGFNLICHNTPEKGEHVSTLSEFADGQTITIRRMGADPSSVILRAEQVLANPKRYHAVKRNCEHTVFEILRGIAKSPAVLAIICVLIIGGILLLLFRQR